MKVLQNSYNGKESWNELGNETNIKELRKQWDIELPHFGGIAPHRYQTTDKYHQVRCVYCWKPQAYNSLKEVA